MAVWLKTTVLGLLGTMTACLLLAACGGSSSPTPYISNQRFEVSGRCRIVTEEGKEPTYDCGCFSSWRTVRGDYASTETPSPFYPACQSRIFWRGSGSRLYFEHYNILLPCFPSAAIDYYTDGDVDDESITDVYAVQANAPNDGGYPIIAGAIHLQESAFPSYLLTDQLCAYHLFVTLEDVEDGEYYLNLWNSERERIVFTDTQNNPLTNQDIKVDK